ncbi:MAG: thioredoxin domain-containing protein [Proteobacteria bacterium]|nr:thioredoxin domain-containing protein [Pseudomonadota bacterium]MBU1710703.1 thioredoxin domain-containing protein [Pseudomonadota bacterium]
MSSTQKDNTAAAYVARQLALGKKSNRLINETSPYLLQHAFNPVNWFPWGDEAFEQALKEGKPVFLSIGYSTCHWCHVMERESFENPDVAAILNKYFISIKVDREERPDIDRIYMEAAQALTGSGGWPLSVFVTPDRLPFYAGTYFPPEAKYGMPGFADLLIAINKAWHDDRQKLLDQADKLVAAIKPERDPQNKEPLTESILLKGFQDFAGHYDTEDGGFGTDAKFPRPVGLNFLLRFHKRSGDKKALEMVLTTLKKMAAGGIHDHMGGGFHRYTVDDQWRVPHFEKMLYDQAQLAVSYLEAYQITGESLFKESVEDIFGYVLRDMTDPNGVFFSAEDADSPRPENPAEHGEGAFYVWTAKEVDQILGKDEADVFSFHYGVKKDGNVLKDPHQEFVGRNILYEAQSLAETAAHFGKPPEEIKQKLHEARRKIIKRRNVRPRPHLDDKVITAENGLMISAFAKGYQVTGEEKYLEVARTAAAFILKELYDPKQKTMFRRFRAGKSGINGMLDDYAFFIQALLDLYEASQDFYWLKTAADLTVTQIALFSDKEMGGFFESAGKDTGLPIRVKSDFEGAEPLGNSIAAINLLRLAQFADKEAWREIAKNTVTAAAARLLENPSAMPQMLVALDYSLSKPKQVIILGHLDAQDTKKMLQEVRKRFLPGSILMVVDPEKNQKQLAEFQPALEWYAMRDNKATAYVCENFICNKPVTEIKDLVKMLDK